MPALSQCWYTRIHVPEGRKHKEPDGSYSCTCRHCHKQIVSWNKGPWYLNEGFNISRLRETTGGRFISVVDVDDDMVVARYPIDHLKGVAAIRDFKLELRKTHGMDELGSRLVLRDSKESTRVH